MTVKRRIAKNKHKTGQRINTKKLLKYKNELEDCVQSQQATIAELQSTITNNQLGHDLMKRKYEDMQKFVQLNRPEILQLMKSLVKHSATGGPTLDIKLVKAKRKAPKIPEAPLPYKGHKAPDGTPVDADGFIIEPGHPQEGALWKNSQGGAPQWMSHNEKIKAAQAAKLLQRAQEKLVQQSVMEAKPLYEPIPAGEYTMPMPVASADPKEVWDPKTRKFVKEKPQ